MVEKANMKSFTIKIGSILLSSTFTFYIKGRQKTHFAGHFLLKQNHKKQCCPSLPMTVIYASSNCFSYNDDGTV